MKAVVKFISQWLQRPQRMSPEDRYLSESVDRVDLERRMRLIQRGQAPFQVYPYI